MASTKLRSAKALEQSLSTTSHREGRLREDERRTPPPPPIRCQVIQVEAGNSGTKPQSSFGDLSFQKLDSPLTEDNSRPSASLYLCSSQQEELELIHPIISLFLPSRSRVSPSPSSAQPPSSPSLASSNARRVQWFGAEKSQSQPLSGSALSHRRQRQEKKESQLFPPTDPSENSNYNCLKSNGMLPIDDNYFPPDLLAAVAALPRSFGSGTPSPRHQPSHQPDEDDQSQKTPESSFGSLLKSIWQAFSFQNFRKSFQECRNDPYEKFMSRTGVLGRFKDKELEKRYQVFSTRMINVAKACAVVMVIVIAEVVHFFLADGGTKVQALILTYLPLPLFTLVYLFNTQLLHRYWKLIISVILAISLISLFFAEYILIVNNSQDPIVATVAIVEMNSFITIVLLMCVTVNVDITVLIPVLVAGYVMLFILYQASYQTTLDIPTAVHVEAFISMTSVTLILIWPIKVLDRMHRRTFELLEKLTGVIDQQRHQISEYEAQLKFMEFGVEEKEIVDKHLMADRSLDTCRIFFEDLEFDKVIGFGSFGEVIRGRYHGTTVAIKRLLRHRISDDYIIGFKQELKLISELRHPNIVQFIGASWDSYSNICVVTEFMVKGDLASVFTEMKSCTWSDPKLRMATDVAMGLAYLHGLRRPVIHRDLKSRNVLVSSTYGCKISDFGLSRIIDIDDTMTMTGTYLWMAAELVRREKYTVQADMYSFGVLLTELDTLCLPFHDAKEADGTPISGPKLLHKVGYEGLRPTVSSACPASVRAFVNRCLSDNPDLRPTAKEAIEILEHEVTRDVREIMSF